MATTKKTLSKVKKKTPPSKKKKSTNTFNIKAFTIKWIIILLFAGVSCVSILFVLVRFGAFGNIPDNNALRGIKNPIASEVYSADGVLLGRYYIQNRSRVEFNEISSNVIQALIATEDARFYNHQGIDEWALARVFIKSVLLGQNAGGGSTLSQQIAKNIYGRQDLGVLSMPVSKFREAIIAYRLENIYNKDEILTLYLNTVPFGENTYGIETAAERFFNKSPHKLNVAEAATLIGMLKANTAYNPRLHPEKAIKRRNTVIQQMVKQEYLSPELGEKWQKTPLNLNYKFLVQNTGSAAYFREMLRIELDNWCKKSIKSDGSSYNLYTDGLRIYTTIDSRLQDYAERSVQKHMESLQQIFEKHWKDSNPFNKAILDRAMQHSDRYKRLVASGKNNDEIKKSFNTPVETRLFSWKGSVNKTITPMDSIKYNLLLLHTGLLAMNPNSGDVKAWVGGNDFQFFQYDHVTSTRQVGSIFKPIVYAAALENGMEPDSYISNARETYGDYDDWSPGNADNFYDGYYSLEGGLCHSVNTVAVKVLLETGIPEVIQMARDLGIHNDLPKVPSLALGAANLSLQEMVTAYCSFANQGHKVSPRYITRIEDMNGKVLENRTLNTDNEEVLNPEYARIINHYLEAVIDSGTSKSIRNQYYIVSDMAGKTGTTQNFADGWFIGYTPQLVVGSWTGAEDPSIHFRSITYGQGAKLALPEVGLLFQYLQKDPQMNIYTNQRFVEPSWEILERLNQPMHIENPSHKVEIKKIFDFFRFDNIKSLNIFKSDTTEEPEKGSKREQRKKAREKRRMEKD